jgi:hypothetical protein
VRHGPRRLDHRVGAVGHDDAHLGTARAAVNNPRAIGVGHIEAVDHHQRLDRRLDSRAPEAQHLGQMGGAKRQPPVDLTDLVEVPPVTRCESGETSAGVSGRWRGVAIQIASAPTTKTVEREGAVGAIITRGR